MSRSPTLTTLKIILVVFVLQLVSVTIGLGTEPFVLHLPLTDEPWTIVTSVYAHGGIMHLIGNCFALLLFGLAVEYFTTPLRYHAFFVLSGALAGIAQVVFTSGLGMLPPGMIRVLGASGAIFALMGYAISGNALSAGLLSRLGRRAQILLIFIIAAVFTAQNAGPGVANMAHFAGIAIGLVAGRFQLLHTTSESNTEDHPDPLQTY